MSVDPQLLSQFTVKIGVRRPSGVGPDGELTYALGLPLVLPARVEPMEHNDDSMRGTNQDSTYRVYVDREIKMEDQVWLDYSQVSDASKARRPKRILELFNEFGQVDHYEVEI